MAKKSPPWRFVSGAPAGYRKLKNRITGKTRLIKMKGAKNPVSVRKLPSGRFQVRAKYRPGQRGHVTARSTTIARAKRQQSLLRAIHHSSWRPTGRPARSVIRRAARKASRARGHNMIFGIRHGRKWTLKTKPVGGQIIARGLSDAAMRARARKAGYHIRSM